MTQANDQQLRKPLNSRLMRALPSFLPLLVEEGCNIPMSQQQNHLHQRASFLIGKSAERSEGLTPVDTVLVYRRRTPAVSPFRLLLTDYSI